MAVVKYTKQHPAVFRPKQRTVRKRLRTGKFFVLHQLGPIFLVVVGFALVCSVAVPILFSQFFSQTELQADAREDFETSSSSAQKNLFGTHREQLLPTAIPTPVVVATQLDYTDLADWFPDHAIPNVTPQETRKYLLSIPKLNIDDAEVVYGGRNMDHNLVQYPDTAMPGDLGSPVIFGHSILRQFYNPKVDNPRRYISIFSTIMTLKKGDPIYLRDDTITYTYRVTGKTEVQPTDLYILDQHLDARELKLVTCTPEGTTLRRGVVTAVLEE